MLDVSRSGYYKWTHWTPGKMLQRKNRLEILVKNTYESFKAAYGSRRIASELKDLGYSCSENLIAQIMKDKGIKAHNGRGFKYPRHSLVSTAVKKFLISTV